MNKKVRFIAEVSSNHSKDIDRCLEFIRESSSIGCDAVKFQLFKIEKLFSPEIVHNSEEVQKRKEWELPTDFLPVLYEECIRLNIQFGCTPFYLDAVNELEPYVSFYKIASYELLWDALLIACAKTGKPVVLSTGMATISEIKHAVTILKKSGCRDITVLHCTSSYPTPYVEANLAAIQTLKDRTGCKVGWSDHTVQSSVIHRAIHKWGAEVVEFHLDLDGKGAEFEAGHCWLPNQIASVIEDVRKGFEADGDGLKEPVESEMPDRLWRTDPSDGLRPFKQLRKQ